MHKKAELKKTSETTELTALLSIKGKTQRREATFLRLHSMFTPELDLELRSPGA